MLSSTACSVEGAQLEVREIGVPIPALPFPGCVISGATFHFPVPQFPHLHNGGNNSLLP